MADQDFIDFRAGLDPSEVNAALKDIEKHAQKHFDKVAKQVDKIDSGMGKLNHQLRGAKKLWSPIVKGLTVEYKRLGQEIEENKTNLKAMIQVARTGSESEKAAAKSRIKELRQIRREKKAAHKEVGKTMGAAGSKAKQETTFDRGEIAKTFKEAGAELREPLDKLLNKDLPSAMGDATKLLGKGMSFWIGGAGGKLEGLGAKLGDKFKDRAMAAGAKGKKGSAMGLQAAGGAMKGLGGIGKLVKMFSSLGPILVGLSSVVVGLVKMFVDAEAQVKEFNKEVLSTAGTAQFLHRNMGDATSGAKALGNTLDQIRDAAFSLDNLDWGISSKDHAAVLQTLQSEGVSLDRMRKDMERTATATKDAAGYVNNWGDLTHMSVAYSRALGVSLAELTQLQGTFMSDIGMGLTSVTMGFQQMTRHAEDAGIASTKFFGIIRGISSDLSLYNTRLEDASKHLATLGKVMSPRNAEKFLQATMNSVKGMGRMEKLKLRVIGGGKQKQIMEEGIARKERQFAGDLGEKGASQAQVDAVLAAKDTTAAVMKLMDELGVDKEGDEND